MDFRDKTHAERVLRMAQDLIITKRLKGELPGQHLMERVAEARAFLEEVPPTGGIATMEVFGHPLATELWPDRYGHLIPIKVNSLAQIEARLEEAQVLFDRLAQEIATTEYHAKQGDRKARQRLKSMNHLEAVLIRDLIHDETLPELNRIHRLLRGDTTT